YVADSGSDDVMLIDTATLAAVATVPVGRAPAAVVADACRAWVAGENQVTVVDAASRAAVASVAVGGGAVALSPDGGHLYVAYADIDGQLFIDMRLVDGGDLADLIKRGPLSAARTVDVIAQVADALDAAHAQALVHRDVKPSNVLLVGTEQAERGVAYLTDFGIARALDGPTVSRTTLGMGSAGYMAPERFTGDDWD